MKHKFKILNLFVILMLFSGISNANILHNAVEKMEQKNLSMYGYSGDQKSELLVKLPKDYKWHRGRISRKPTFERTPYFLPRENQRNWTQTIVIQYVSDRAIKKGKIDLLEQAEGAKNSAAAGCAKAKFTFIKKTPNDIIFKQNLKQCGPRGSDGDQFRAVRLLRDKTGMHSVAYNIDANYLSVALERLAMNTVKSAHLKH